MMKKIILGLLILLLASCAPSYLILHNGAYPAQKLEGVIGVVNINDKRVGTTEIDLPFLTWIGTHEFNQPIRQEYRDSILAELKRNVSGVGSQISLDINIIQARVGYKNTGFTEKMYGAFKLQINIHNSQYGCIGDAYLEKGTINSTEASLKKIFEEGLRLSTYKCLEYLEKARESIPTGTDQI